MTPRVNLETPEFLADRRASYRKLRHETPFALAEINGEELVVVSRYADADALLKHSKSVVQPSPGEQPPHIRDDLAGHFYRVSVANRDAPDHVRLRNVFNPLFSANAMVAMKSEVEDIIRRKLDALEASPGAEFVEQIAFAIPVEVACGLTDIPVEDAPRLVSSIGDMIANRGYDELDAAALARCDAAANLFSDYFERQVIRNKDLPTTRITGALLKAEREGHLTHEEVIVILTDMFLASIHTTMTSLSNATIAFAEHPDQLSLLAEDPSLAARAWEEVLRYQAPIHFRHRFMSAPVDLDGFRIEPRTKVMIGLASANWDETKFEDPDTFNIARPPHRQHAFGGGRHTCLGAHLSRLEGSIYLPELARRYKEIRISQPIARINDLTFPHVEKMFVEFIRK